MMDAREFCILAYIKWPGKQAAVKMGESTADILVA